MWGGGGKVYALSQCVLCVCVCACVCFSGLEDASSSSPKATYVEHLFIGET